MLLTEGAELIVDLHGKLPGGALGQGPVGGWEIQCFNNVDPIEPQKDFTTKNFTKKIYKIYKKLYWSVSGW